MKSSTRTTGRMFNDNATYSHSLTHTHSHTHTQTSQAIIKGITSRLILSFFILDIFFQVFRKKAINGYDGGRTYSIYISQRSIFSFFFYSFTYSQIPILFSRCIGAKKRAKSTPGRWFQSRGARRKKPLLTLCARKKTNVFYLLCIKEDGLVSIV